VKPCEVAFEVPREGFHMILYGISLEKFTFAAHAARAG
jgi:hypothetical protein